MSSVPEPNLSLPPDAQRLLTLISRVEDQLRQLIDCQTDQQLHSTELQAHLYQLQQLSRQLQQEQEHLARRRRRLRALRKAYQQLWPPQLRRRRKENT